MSLQHTHLLEVGLKLVLNLGGVRLPPRGVGHELAKLHVGALVEQDVGRLAVQGGLRGLLEVKNMFMKYM